jgi:hypothetical protein
MNLKQNNLRFPQNAKNKNSIIELLLKLKNTSLWVILLFLTQSILYAQSYGDIGGTPKDTWIINDDDSNNKSALRIQDANSAWLFVKDGNKLDFRFADNTTHTNYGNSRMGLNWNGRLDVYGGIKSHKDISLKPGNGIGLKFYNSSLYKIHMGSGNSYSYGPVSSYAIKSNMSSESNRGWVWGVHESTPIAALNTQGNMKLKGNMDVNTLTVGTNKIIEGARAHFDGRVYISEENGYEEGFGSKTKDNYKDYLLWVEEGIVSTDFALAELTEWPDYVFYNDYKLPSLANVEKNIKENGHLHTMPSAKEVEENGFTVKDMTKRVVKTIEELTLHTIAQEKQIEAQNKLIEKLSKRLEKLEQANK